MRTLYETESDTCKQECVRRIIEGAFNRLLLGPLKLSWRADYFGTKFNYRQERIITSLIEIKCRTHDIQTFETLIVSFDKIRRLHQISACFAAKDRVNGILKNLHPNVILVVAFGLGVYYTIANEDVCKSFEIKWGGRIDRDDSKDMEKLYHVPINVFKRIGTL